MERWKTDATRVGGPPALDRFESSLTPKKRKLKVPGAHDLLLKALSASHVCSGTPRHGHSSNLWRNVVVRNSDATHWSLRNCQVLWSEPDHRCSQQKSPIHVSTVFFGLISHILERRYPSDTIGCAMIRSCCILLQNAATSSSSSTATFPRKILLPFSPSSLSVAERFLFTADDPTSCVRSSSVPPQQIFVWLQAARPLPPELLGSPKARKKGQLLSAYERCRSFHTAHRCVGAGWSCWASSFLPLRNHSWGWCLWRFDQFYSIHGQRNCFMFLTTSRAMSRLFKISYSR